MIQLTRLNHSQVILNSDLIEIIEVTPDTVITLTTGQKLRVLESADDVTEKVREFRRSLIEGAFWQATRTLQVHTKTPEHHDGSAAQLAG